MKRFIEGEDRLQGRLLPECLDDYIAQDNPVRVVDAFVEELDLQAVGFTGVEPAQTGRPSYHPAVLLKIYIYGYLNRIQSSRRLERECQRNMELMWLTGRLAPDFKTIADFRRDSGKGIRNASRQFVTICRRLKLLAQCQCRGGWQQVQGGEQPGPQLHAAQARATRAPGRREHRALSGGTGYRRPHAAGRSGIEDGQTAGQTELAAAADEAAAADRHAASPATGRATVTDRSGRAFDGHERARHRNGGLQRADRGRHQAPLDRRP